jgi:hypothetical protein
VGGLELTKVVERGIALADEADYTADRTDFAWNAITAVREYVESIGTAAGQGELAYLQQLEMKAAERGPHTTSGKAFAGLLADLGTALPNTDTSSRALFVTQLVERLYSRAKDDMAPAVEKDHFAKLVDVAAVPPRS